jgi:hypothetical protein
MRGEHRVQGVHPVAGKCGRIEETEVIVCELFSRKRGLTQAYVPKIQHLDHQGALFDHRLYLRGHADTLSLEPALHLPQLALLGLRRPRAAHRRTVRKEGTGGQPPEHTHHLQPLLLEYQKRHQLSRGEHRGYLRKPVHRCTLPILRTRAFILHPIPAAGGEHRLD